MHGGCPSLEEILHNRPILPQKMSGDLDNLLPQGLMRRRWRQWYIKPPAFYQQPPPPATHLPTLAKIKTHLLGKTPTLTKRPPLDTQHYQKDPKSYQTKIPAPAKNTCIP